MTYEWTKGSPAYPGIPDFDPYGEWVLGPGRPYYFGAEGTLPWIPVLLLLDGVTPSEFADGADLVAESGQAHPQSMVGSSLPSRTRRLPGPDPGLLQDLTNTRRERVTDQLSGLCRPILSTTARRRPVKSRVSSMLFTAGPRRVVMGIIDDGTALPMSASAGPTARRAR